eukprot:TRINITY_DN2987_c0_g1_i1.p1 TRINITY_DN2987_c0_g1~~TRINITY_DN2987_c0_g1_i1.p1  ORF type:complete len:483 (-),score=111.97 TRINITY_DN2987_c0_g1_i1:280-1728(-)
MGWPHQDDNHGYWLSSICANPIRFVFRNHAFKLSSKLSFILRNFETTLAERWIELELKLKEKHMSLNLQWMQCALEVLCRIHNDLRALVADLQFPVSKWDDNVIDQYLSETLYLLDICIALLSEKYSIENGQLFARYGLHLLNFCDGMTEDKLSKAKVAVQDFLAFMKDKRQNVAGDSREKIGDCPQMIENMAKNLQPGKGRSGKGKVLCRSAYGVRVATVFICSILVSAFLDSHLPLERIVVPDQFLWAGSFMRLQEEVSEEMRGWTIDDTGMKLEEVGRCEVAAEGVLSVIQAVEANTIKNRHKTSAEAGLNNDLQTGSVLPKETGHETQRKLDVEGKLENKTKIIEKKFDETQRTVCCQDKAQVRHDAGNPQNNTLAELVQGHEVHTGAATTKEESGQEATVPFNSIVWTLEQEKQLAHAVQELKQSSDLLSELLGSFKKQVNEFFHIVLEGRNDMLHCIRLSHSHDISIWDGKIDRST